MTLAVLNFLFFIFVLVISFFISLLYKSTIDSRLLLDFISGDKSSFLDYLNQFWGVWSISELSEQFEQFWGQFKME